MKTIKGASRKLLNFVFGVVAAGVIVIATGGAASAYSYDGVGAVHYAHLYACNGTDCHNNQYLYLGSDCANFVSQSIHDGGGLTYLVGVSSVLDWFYDSNTVLDRTGTSQVVYSGSASWVSVSALYDQLRFTNRLSSIANPTMSLKYSGANSGDIYMYDWGKGEGFSHVALATDNGTFINYQDPVTLFNPSPLPNYSTITGGSGSRMAQHTTDRDWAPWNYGYWGEHDAGVRAKMRTKILRIAPAG